MFRALLPFVSSEVLSGVLSELLGENTIIRIRHSDELIYLLQQVSVQSQYPRPLQLSEMVLARDDFVMVKVTHLDNNFS